MYVDSSLGLPTPYPAGSPRSRRHITSVPRQSRATPDTLFSSSAMTTWSTGRRRCWPRERSCSQVDGVDGQGPQPAPTHSHPIFYWLLFRQRIYHHACNTTAAAQHLQHLAGAIWPASAFGSTASPAARVSQRLPSRLPPCLPSYLPPCLTSCQPSCLAPECFWPTCRDGWWRRRWPWR